jgi:hypothetical protein
MMRRSFVTLSLTLAALALACGGGDSTPPLGIVQLVDITTGGLSSSCGRLNHLADPDSLYIHVHMVNTTDSDVPIDSIGSSGSIIRTSDDSHIGQSAMSTTSTPFTPKPALLQAHTGDVTMVVSYSTTALCAASFSALDYMDVMASVRVTTPVGQYISDPITIHVVYSS